MLWLGVPVPSTAQEAGSELDVALLTVGPGKYVWEKFGHNAIGVVDRATGRARSYNYGLFDFRQQNFLLRFVQGRMWYAMGSRSAQREIDMYTRADRTVVLQRLGLSPAERASLQAFLAWNDTDEHRHYHYDYYRDNCSTRVRDALDRALGGDLRARFDTMATGTTYRWHTARLTTARPLLYAGLMVAMGRPIDAPLSAWEEMFLPMKVAEHLRGVSRRDASGASVPLVVAETVVHTSTRYPDPERPAALGLPFLAVGLLVGAGLWLAGRSRRPAGRTAYRVLGTALSVVAGLGGLFLLGTWFLTDHVVARQNASVLLLSPLSLVLAFLLPGAARDTPRRGRAALGTALLVLALAALAVVAHAWPGFHQPIAELLLLILPIHLGVVLGLLAVLRRDAQAPTA
jgi:hypothetical protein